MKAFLIGLLLVACASTAPQASAAEDFSTTVVFKDANGDLSQKSQENLRKLLRLCAEQGRIDLWVTFDMTFQGDPSLRTPEVIAHEALQKRSHMQDSIAPLIRQRKAHLLEIPTALRQAPGVPVRVTAAGLRSLVRDAGVKHISLRLSPSE